MIAWLAFAIGSDKKGLQIQMIDDAIQLGVRRAGLNVLESSFLDDRLQVRPEAIDAFAATVQPLRRAGMRVYVIFLNHKSGKPELDRVLLHPKFDPRAPNGYSAFNVVTPEGIDALRRVTTAIARRLPGDIEGWIVGNEVNSHWEWANQGEATCAEVADSTERAMRIVHESTRRPAYLSLEHHWTMRGATPERSTTGREMLETVARLARERGDFEWRLAFHPYPENLFEPRFWNDRLATLSFDTKKITFKNLEVITEFMKRKELLWRGRPRPVNLSEEGFHRADSPEGEIAQAAAYAYAYQRVVRNDLIEAFILNRHVDHKREGGLQLGLWTRKPQSICDPERRTRMYDVFKACGTSDEAKAIEFALPFIGLRSWDESRPRAVR